MNPKNINKKKIPIFDRSRDRFTRTFSVLSDRLKNHRFRNISRSAEFSFKNFP